MLKVKVTQVGNSMGILLPKEALKKLKAEKGDMLYLVENLKDTLLLLINRILKSK